MVCLRKVKEPVVTLRLIDVKRYSCKGQPITWRLEGPGDKLGNPLEGNREPWRVLNRRTC